ncbi:MAG: cytochrome c [Chloroflexi bacterium]|nr:cytochrome c [Chloroflexota bacterium]
MKHFNLPIQIGILLVLTLVLASCAGAAPAGAPANAPQVSAADATVKDGKTLFTNFCAKCHGLGGLGDGPSVGSLRTQAGLNLTLLGERSDRDIFATVSAGKGTEMPPFELRLNKEQREELVKYLRTLAKK